MSTRTEGSPRGALLDEDDDWFATVQPQQVVEADDLSWENELEWELREPAPPDLARRQGAIVLAVVAAVLLVLAGILIGRQTKSSSTKVVTVTTAQTQETPSAAGTQQSSGATTTSGSTADTTTTGATTTGATTTGATTTPSTDTGTSTPSTGSSTPDSSAVPTGATLRPGDKGASVIALQRALTTLGYTPGTADGTYGPTTAQAVAAFQTAKSLTADGIAGAKTLAAINATLASG